MLLASEDGSELELHLVGYRFPAVTADPWDSNTLLVAIRSVAPGRAWEAVDPCLTTWEAAALIRWLRALSMGSGTAVARSFNEPNLTMAVRRASPDLTRLCVRACFALESRPPWLPGPARGRDTLCVDLDVDQAALAEAAADLAGDLERYPQRGDDPTL